MLVRVHRFGRCDFWIFPLVVLNCQSSTFSENTGKFLVLFLWKRGWRPTVQWLSLIFFLEAFAENHVRNSHSLKGKEKAISPRPSTILPIIGVSQTALGGHRDCRELAGHDHFLFKGLKWAATDEPGLRRTMHVGSNCVKREENVLFLAPYVLKAVLKVWKMCRRCLAWLWQDKQMTHLCNYSSLSASGYQVSQCCAPVTGPTFHWWEVVDLDTYCMLKCLVCKYCIQSGCRAAL